MVSSENKGPHHHGVENGQKGQSWRQGDSSGDWGSHLREEGVLTVGRVHDGRRVGRRDLERDRIDKTSTLSDWNEEGENQRRHPNFGYGTQDEGCYSVDIQGGHTSNCGINKQLCSYTMDYYSAIERNEVLIHATDTWMNLENLR